MSSIMEHFSKIEVLNAAGEIPLRSDNMSAIHHLAHILVQMCEALGVDIHYDPVWEDWEDCKE